MRKLLLPIFIARLLVVQVPFLGLLIWVLLLPYASLLITLCFLGVYAIILGNQLASSLTQKLVPQFSTLDQPSRPHLKIRVAATQTTALASDENTLRQTLAHITTQLRFQPTHRDLLLNAALIEQALGNQTTAERLYDQARQVDPNDTHFAE